MVEAVGLLSDFEVSVVGVVEAVGLLSDFEVSVVGVVEVVGLLSDFEVSVVGVVEAVGLLSDFEVSVVGVVEAVGLLSDFEVSVVGVVEAVGVLSDFEVSVVGVVEAVVLLSDFEDSVVGVVEVVGVLSDFEDSVSDFESEDPVVGSEVFVAVVLSSLVCVFFPDWSLLSAESDELLAFVPELFLVLSVSEFLSDLFESSLINSDGNIPTPCCTLTSPRFTTGDVIISLVSVLLSSLLVCSVVEVAESSEVSADELPVELLFVVSALSDDSLVWVED